MATALLRLWSLANPMPTGDTCGQCQQKLNTVEFKVNLDAVEWLEINKLIRPEWELACKANEEKVTRKMRKEFGST